MTNTFIKILIYSLSLFPSSLSLALFCSLSLSLSPLPSPSCILSKTCMHLHRSDFQISQSSKGHVNWSIIVSRVRIIHSIDLDSTVKWCFRSTYYVFPTLPRHIVENRLRDDVYVYVCMYVCVCECAVVLGKGWERHLSTVFTVETICSSEWEYISSHTGVQVFSIHHWSDPTFYGIIYPLFL